MDILLARTFLAVIAEGNFGAAAATLLVSQSAVSLRIKRLEDMLGQRLFERSKSGVALTPAGRRLERFAVSMMRIWEEARHQVAVPEGYGQTFILGAEYSLLPQFAMRWLHRLETHLPEVAFRIEAGRPEFLMRLLLEGALDMAIMYTPLLRPGVHVEKLFEEELVLVSSDPTFGPALDHRYVFVDWGAEFRAAHGIAYPDHVTPRTTFAVGSLGLESVMRQGRAGYFPARVVQDHLAAGDLHLVPDAAPFTYPSYVVFGSGLDEALRKVALRELHRVVRALDTRQDEILDDLEDISETPVASMGPAVSGPESSLKPPGSMRSDPPERGKSRELLVDSGRIEKGRPRFTSDSMRIAHDNTMYYILA